MTIRRAMEMKSALFIFTPLFDVAMLTVVPLAAAERHVCGAVVNVLSMFSDRQIARRQQRQ